MKKSEYCPFCEKETEVLLQEKLKCLEVRNTKIEYMDKFNKCSTCDNEFDSEENPDSLRDIVYPLYREKFGYIKPHQIVDFRIKLGITQKELSILLGWGLVTISRYENGALQDDAHDSALQMVMMPQGMCALLKKHPELFSGIKRKRVYEWATQDFAETLSTFLSDVSNHVKIEVRKHFDLTRKTDKEYLKILKGSNLKREIASVSKSSFNKYRDSKLHRSLTMRKVFLNG